MLFCNPNAGIYEFLCIEVAPFPSRLSSSCFIYLEWLGWILFESWFECVSLELSWIWSKPRKSNSTEFTARRWNNCGLSPRDNEHQETRDSRRISGRPYSNLCREVEAAGFLVRRQNVLFIVRCHQNWVQQTCRLGSLLHYILVEPQQSRSWLHRIWLHKNRDVRPTGRNDSNTCQFTLWDYNGVARTTFCPGQTLWFLHSSVSKTK